MGHSSTGSRSMTHRHCAEGHPPLGGDGSAAGLVTVRSPRTEGSEWISSIPPAAAADAAADPTYTDRRDDDDTERRPCALIAGYTNNVGSALQVATGGGLKHRREFYLR